jgi:hypothetical protein
MTARKTSFSEKRSRGRCRLRVPVRLAALDMRGATFPADGVSKSPDFGAIDG